MDQNIKVTMTDRIKLSYSAPAAIKVEQAESDRLKAEIAKIEA